METTLDDHCSTETDMPVVHDERARNDRALPGDLLGTCGGGASALGSREREAEAWPPNVEHVPGVHC